MCTMHAFTRALVFFPIFPIHVLSRLVLSHTPCWHLAASMGNLWAANGTCNENWDGLEGKRVLFIDITTSYFQLTTAPHQFSSITQQTATTHMQTQAILTATSCNTNDQRSLHMHRLAAICRWPISNTRSEKCNSIFVLGFQTGRGWCTPPPHSCQDSESQPETGPQKRGKGCFGDEEMQIQGHFPVRIMNPNRKTVVHSATPFLSSHPGQKWNCIFSPVEPSATQGSASDSESEPGIQISDSGFGPPHPINDQPHKHSVGSRPGAFFLKCAWYWPPANGCKSRILIIIVIIQTRIYNNNINNYSNNPN